MPLNFPVLVSKDALLRAPKIFYWLRNFIGPYFTCHALEKILFQDYGVYLEELGHTLRGLFIVDKKGILRQITMNDLPVGRSVDETLRLVQAFQYTDTHADVCPSGWKPGHATIIPNPKDKLKYFSEVNAAPTGEK